MKKNLFFTLTILISVFTNCDKVENAYPEPETELDISLYPGSWSDYLENEYPEFGDNTAQLQNVIIEEYTGHRCNNCPTAAATAYSLVQSNPDRVFLAAIHSGPGGMTSFQEYNETSSQFFTNHTNEEGLAYGKYFQNGFNFFGNPQGTVNRQTIDNKMFDFHGTWGTRVDNLLDNNDILVRLQSVFNYFPASNGGYLHVEVEKNNTLSTPINVVVFVIKEEEENWQTMPDNSYNENYIHKHKHLGSIDNRPWGRTALNEASSIGEKVVLDYDYKIPDGLDVNNMHFLIFAYDTETYEIYQVIKQEVE